MDKELIRLVDLFNLADPEEPTSQDEEEVRLADLFTIEEE